MLLLLYAIENETEQEQPSSSLNLGCWRTEVRAALISVHPGSSKAWAGSYRAEVFGYGF